MHSDRMTVEDPSMSTVVITSPLDTGWACARSSCGALWQHVPVASVGGGGGVPAEGSCQVVALGSGRTRKILKG